MGIPRRVRDTSGRYSLVDGIPFAMPVTSQQTPALLAAFPINAERAKALLPGNELHPLRLWGNTALLVVTVVDYRVTNIGKYIEFSIGIACTRGARPAPAARSFSGFLWNRAVCLRFAGQHGNLRQGRQGHLGNAQASGKPRFSYRR